MRRRRHQGASCEDGFGEVITSNYRQGRFLGRAGSEGSRSRRQGGCPSGGKGAGKDPSSSTSSRRRPAVMFLAQAVLSFVGMVVIPTRLAYEVLVVQPPPSASAGPGAVSLDLRSGASPGALTAGAAASGRAADGGGGEHRRLSDSHGSGLGVDGGEEGEGLRTGSKGRVLQTAEDSFTYTSRTQFHLCAALPGSSITEEALRAGVMDVFGVEETQVRVCVCVCSAVVCLPCVSAPPASLSHEKL